MIIDVTKLKNIVIGLYVGIIDDSERYLEDEAPIRRGYVKKILSKSDNDKGIKVLLTNGRKGRIEEIYSKYEIKKENFKFYNKFFHSKKIFTLWDKKNGKYVVIMRQNKITNKNEMVSFLFSDIEVGREYVKKLNNKDIVIKGINSKIKVTDNFKDLGIKKFIIDNKKKTSCENLIKWEEYVTQY